VGDASGHVEGVGVTHRDDLINEARVVVRRPEVLTHAFGQIRPALATGIDRTFGSAATILIAGFCSLRNFATPHIVPPVPAPATKCVTVPSVSRQISGPVVV